MTTTEKYGFVYIWRDRKHKRYYIGCRWGTIDDGYICSSRWMRNSFRRRPEDFKRRIVAIVSDRKILLDEEYKWLQLIENAQLGKKYYNLQNHHFNHWSNNDDARLTVGQKISASPNRKANISKAHKAINFHHTDETKEKIRQIRLGSKQSPETIAKKIASTTGKKRSQDFCIQKSYYASNRSQETKDKIANNSRRLVKEGKIGMFGKQHSDETKLKMAEKARQRMIKCDHCEVVGPKSVMNKWHFDNCKILDINKKKAIGDPNEY